MTASIKPAYNTKRIKLADVLPLDTPFRITVSPTHYCNLKCYFCTQALIGKDNDNILGFKRRHMSLAEFRLIADQLNDFPNKLKLMVFSGMGEPLLNRDFIEMVRYAKQNHVAERVELYTNATLLTEDISDRLINAGLDVMRISLYGLDEQAYLKNTKLAKMDFPSFLSNVEYYYNNKIKSKLHVKIIDSLLGEYQPDEFYKMFKNICDDYYIEHLCDNQVCTQSIKNEINSAKNIYNETLPKSSALVCPQIFYSLYADANCNIYPCTLLAPPVSFALGNCRNEKIVDMWNGDELKKRRLMHLKGKRAELNVCGDCGNLMSMYHPEDDLDDFRNILTEKFIID